MYSLYGHINTWKVLKTDNDINEVVDKLTEEIYLHDSIEYLIIYSTKEQDFPFATIQNMEDYNALVHNYGYNKEKARTRKKK